jgi:hypothetical protein
MAMTQTSRTFRLFVSSAFTDQQIWEDQVEHPLRSLLVEATSGMELAPAARLKYLASATEQEIGHGALGVSTAQEQVFYCLREITNRDQLVASAHEHEQARAFIDLDQQGRLDQQAHVRLGELKDRLSRALPGHIQTYKATWTKSRLSTDHIGTLPETLEACIELIENDEAPSTLCVDVWRRLSRVIMEEIVQLEEADALEREIAAHDAFGESRANPKYFTGRTEILHTIDEYVQSVTCYPLVVFGTSGSGSWDETVRVWDLASGACRHTLSGHTDKVNSVSVTPTARPPSRGVRMTPYECGTWPVGSTLPFSRNRAECTLSQKSQQAGSSASGQGADKSFWRRFGMCNLRYRA